MTISQFTSMLGNLRIRWFVTREGWIRGPNWLCPIQAVASLATDEKKDLPKSAKHLEMCARRLYLSPASRDKIICAADNTARADPRIRDALMICCRLQGPNDYLVPETLDHHDILPATAQHEQDA